MRAAPKAQPRAAVEASCWRALGIPMWRDAVARDLAEAGYEVVATAGDGVAAVRRGKATRPRVVALDMQIKAQPLAAVERIAAGDPVLTPGLAGLVLGEFRKLARLPDSASRRGRGAVPRRA